MKHSISLKIAKILARMAKKLAPDDPEVHNFYMKLFTDQMIYGKSIVRINPVDTFLNGDEK